jgi:hypothetical protein
MNDAHDRDPEAADAGAAHEADRPPTPDEERTAEQVAAEVDPATAEHYREMAERGAKAKGEGEILPE